MCVWQSNDSIRRKQVGTSYVNQSYTLKYVVHVLGGAVSKKYKYQHCSDDLSRVRLGQSFKTVGYGSASCWGDVGAGSVEAET